MKACGITDVGKVRKQNQDSFIIRQNGDRVIGVVCDGMGGARSGNIAASLAAECFAEHISTCLEQGDILPVRELVREAANYSNVKVYDRAFTDFTCEGMGTTLVGGVFHSEHAYIANVGDSRAYKISNGSIRQITTDHSYVQELVRDGIISSEAARNHPKRNYITRALGLAREVECDIYSVNIQRGNTIILCTDGLSNIVTPEEMLEISQSCESAEMLSSELMRLALSRDASDNVTVAVFRF